MGFDRRFSAVTIMLVTMLGAALIGMVAAFERAYLGAARVIAVLAVAALTIALVRHVERTNRLLASFVEAVQQKDFAARFSNRGAQASRPWATR